MALPQPLRTRDGLVRAGLTAALGAFALSSLRKGKRLRGVLAGLAALGVGYGASTGVDVDADTVADVGDRVVDTGELPGTDSTSEDGGLRCAACGDPIVPGQPRGPDENDETVHEACLEASA